MKVQLRSAIIIVLAIVGLSIYARGGGGRGGGGFHGGGHAGGGFHGGVVRSGGWNRGGWNRGGWGWDGGWGYGPAVGFGVDVSSAPTVVNCVYATPPDSYYQYRRQFTDPVSDQAGYQNWLKANYRDASNQWDQFQRYLDYKACSKGSSKPNVSFGIGTGYGYGGYPYRRGYWR